MVAIAVQEEFGVSVDQRTVFVVVEVLPPHWIILDVLFLLLHGDLHFVFAFLVRVIHCLVFDLRRFRHRRLSQVFLYVVHVVFEEIESSLFLDFAPCQVGLLLVIELVVWILGISQVPQGME